MNWITGLMQGLLAAISKLTEKQEMQAKTSEDAITDDLAKVNRNITARDHSAPRA